MSYTPLWSPTVAAALNDRHFQRLCGLDNDAPVTW